MWAINRALAQEKGTILMRNERVWWIVRSWLILGLVGLAMAGCANLSGIRDFAKISSATAEHTQLVSQYVDWPSAQKRFQPESQYPKLDEMIAKRQAQKDALLLRHTLIQEYMDALGHLAADEAVIYDKEVGKLGTAAKDAKFLDDKEEKAFEAVANLVLRAATDAWRQGKLRELIRESNEPLQTSIAGLKKIVDQGFGGDLDAEKLAINAHYDIIEAQSSDKAAKAALEEWRTVRLDDVAKREQAIKTYSSALSKIAEAHQKLFDGLDHLNSKELLSTLNGYTKDLRKAYSALKAL